MLIQHDATKIQSMPLYFLQIVLVCCQSQTTNHKCIFQNTKHKICFDDLDNMMCSSDGDKIIQ